MVHLQYSALGLVSINLLVSAEAAKSAQECKTLSTARTCLTKYPVSLLFFVLCLNGHRATGNKSRDLCLRVKV